MLSFDDYLKKKLECPEFALLYEKERVSASWQVFEAMAIDKDYFSCRSFKDKK